MSDQHEKRLSWLAFVFESAIKHGVFRPADVITHATPEILAKDLPKELLVRLFDVSFEAGKLTPEGILGVAPPATLAKHIASSVLWEVVRDAATRHGIAAASANVPKTGKTPLRSWIAEVLANGLEREIFTPADVTRHVPPGEWVKDVPLEVVAKMIASGLTRPQFDPRLALEHLTPQIIGEFVAPNLSWGIIDEGAARAYELSPAKAGGARGAASTIKPPTLTSPAPVAAPLAAPVPAPVAAAPAAPATQPAGWDASSAESADSWVETDEMVETVETSSN